MLFVEGAQYPPQDELERLAEYEIGRKFFDGQGGEVYEKAIALLKNTPHYENIKQIKTAVGLVELLCKKPADMLVADAPVVESGQKGTEVQERLSSIVEENDLLQLIYEMTVANGYLGDQFLKTYYAYRQDFSELLALGGTIPKNAQREIIVESVNPRFVFVELKEGSSKQATAFNIATTEWVETSSGDILYLNVERHIAGAILYRRFVLGKPNVQVVSGIPLMTYTITEEVPAAKNDVFTGVEYPLVQHMPYKTTADHFYGESFVTRVKDYIIAIQETLVQISYILARHTDPIVVSPPIDGQSSEVKMTGGILEVSKEDVTPFYLVWDGKLTDSFQLLDYYINLVFQQAETPQWVFGNVIGSGNQGGGTSHTTEGSNRMRLFPLLAKVRAIRAYVDKAVRTTLWIGMELENYAKDGQDGFVPYEPVYPSIRWKDGIPRDLKGLAETLAISTGGKPVSDQLGAIKAFHEVNDDEAQAILEAIGADEERLSLASPDFFNQGLGEELEEPEEAASE